MKRNFEEWLSHFRNTIATHEYFVDFKKVYQNIETIRVELCILNSLLGSPQIEVDFRNLIEKYPEILKCIPILLAIRQREILMLDENNAECLYQFHSPNLPIEKYVDFMHHTGLFNLIQNRNISNLVDYVTGVETGLDSNGRKNRGGHLMENLVESYLQNAGFVKEQSYFREMYRSEIETRWNLDLSAISNHGKAEKRFDFVVKTPQMVYGIETNFYASNGSKLNEVARSYKNLALDSAPIPGFTFVWITDGKGWNSARHNLEETFDVLETIYSIDDMENGIFSRF